MIRENQLILMCASENSDGVVYILMVGGVLSALAWIFLVIMMRFIL